MRTFMCVVMVLVGIVCLIAPYALEAFGLTVSGISSMLMSVFGIGLLLLVGFLALIFNVYQKTKANEAFVRTGLGGRKVIVDGGALVIPVFHEIIKITLETLRLQVARENETALVTSDKLRADVIAEFYVRVEPTEEAIIKAAQSLGERMLDVNQINEIVEDKLTSALRSVAAKRTLAQLHQERDDFVQAVLEGVNQDLAHNGLTLEAVTISKLDQTKVEYLSESNIFDAEGRRTIAEITEKAKTSRNQLERDGERARKQQDVTTRQEVLTLEQTLQTAEAKQAAAIAAERAAASREAREKELTAQKAVELAELQKAQAVALEGIANGEAAQVATVKQQETIKLATEAQKRSVELASMQREQSVVEATKLKAAEEAALQKALAERQAATENVETVKVKAAAERAKEQAVISAQAAAEAAYVTSQRQADASAYKVLKDADARKAAADADAEAKIKAANADQAAELAKVTAQRAREMVPVDVEKGRVEVAANQVAVDKDRLEHVTIPELQARESHGKVAQEFELSQLEISKRAEVQIAIATAMGTMAGKIDMKVFGSPQDVEKMTTAFLGGEAVNSLLRGLGSNMTGADVLDGLAAAATKVIDRASQPSDKS